MRFYALLKRKLKLSEEKLKLLPRSYQIIGKILVIKLKPELLKHRKLIGRKILEIFPYVHTIVLEKGIRTKTRKPDIEIIVGCKRTQTLHKEHKYQFLLDVSQIMWSKGNKTEKQRLVKLQRSNETIVDMFAGIGYFSIFLAKRAKKIYAIDINPKALEYLKKNVWMNKVEDKIEILEGDCRKYSKLLENIADRIIMGYLYETEKFLPYALKIAKKNCVIHFHRTISLNEKEKIKKILSKNFKILKIVKVKSYAPKIDHLVFDLKKR
jgi:tRNA wybutosine-synthesizing protein 2